MKIGYRSTDNVQSIINSLGRTEDIRFSPNNRRLAMAAYHRGRIAIVNVEISRVGGRPDVYLSGCVEIAPSSLHNPHGVDFLDDETLVVANREGDVDIFKLPLEGSNDADLSPIQVLTAGNDSLLFTPGSLAVVRGEGRTSELLVCNNYRDTVTRHSVDPQAGCAVIESGILLRKGLNLPDGVCVSHDRKWIAISNHSTNGVLLYERSAALNSESSPVGVLRGPAYPHGLRFSADDRSLVVADAGSPYLYVYSQGCEGWHGTRRPAATIRVIDEEVFRAGRVNPQEGGIKGIDFDKSMTVLATTCHHQPLQFLDAEAVLAAASSGSPVMEVEYELGIIEVSTEFKAYARNLQDQFHHLRETAAMAEAKAAAAESRAVAAESRTVATESRAIAAESQARRVSLLATYQEQRAEKFKAKAAKAKAKAARAKARAGFVIGGTPWRITAPFSWLYYALKRPN